MAHGDIDLDAPEADLLAEAPLHEGVNSLCGVSFPLAREGSRDIAELAAVVHLIEVQDRDHGLDLSVPVDVQEREKGDSRQEVDECCWLYFRIQLNVIFIK